MPFAISRASSLVVLSEASGLSSASAARAQREPLTPVRAMLAILGFGQNSLKSRILSYKDLNKAQFERPPFEAFRQPGAFDPRRLSPNPS